MADALQELVRVTTASQFGSDLQPEVRFRGFRVGPVVGYPQSVSVFVDGVRVNKPDASQVNFDLIPLHAVERIEVIRNPGAPSGATPWPVRSTWSPGGARAAPRAPSRTRGMGLTISAQSLARARVRRRRRNSRL